MWESVITVDRRAVKLLRGVTGRATVIMLRDHRAVPQPRDQRRARRGGTR
jgi:hypothetical protein